MLLLAHFVAEFWVAPFIVHVYEVVIEWPAEHGVVVELVYEFGAPVVNSCPDHLTTIVWVVLVVSHVAECPYADIAAGHGVRVVTLIAAIDDAEACVDSGLD